MSAPAQLDFFDSAHPSTRPADPRDTFAELEALAAGGFRAGCIYADPPHSFSTFSAKGRGRCADRHYEVMTHSRILGMGPLVQALAAPNCALFLWSSGVFAERSLEIARAWGFAFKNFSFVWLKTRKGCETIEPDELAEKELSWGTGFTTRANAEFVLLAKRGSPPRLNNDIHQVVIAPRRAHSEKPEEVARRTERLYPGPRLELFARRQRPGWVCWGNEVEPLATGGNK